MFFAIILLLSTKVFAECTHGDRVLRCLNFISNYDGDTITVDIPGVIPFFGKNAKVRVYGVDTPELYSKAPCEGAVARLAKDFVHSILERAERLDLQNISRGKFFRIVGDVVVDGESLSDKLLAANLAIPYYGGKRQVVNWCLMGS